MATSRSFISLSISMLLAACGGGSSPSPAEPPAPTPPAPQAGIVLLAENLGGYFFPGGIAVDAAGTIYVGNSARHQVHKISPAGAVSDFAGSPAVAPGVDGVGDKAGFDYIDQIVYDKRSQSLYAVDRHYQETSGTLRRIGMAGEVSTLKLSSFSSHASPGQVGATNYGDRPASLAAGADGGLYAATMLSAEPHDGGGPHISYTGYRFLSWRTVEADGSGRPLFSQEIYYSRFGSLPDESSPDYLYPSDVSATGGVLGFNLLGLALDHAGNGYIADTDRNVIIKVTPTGVASIFAGAVKTEGAVDGSGAAARFRRPTQLVVDKADNLYVLDRGNSTVRKITPAGVVSTVAGVAGQDKTVAGPLPGGLGTPSGLAIDDAGRLYLTVEKGVVRVQLP
jgi:hypothetical protein